MLGAFFRDCVFGSCVDDGRVRRFYQRDWHGIPFDSLGEVSTEKLPNTSFYRGFYGEFFKRFPSMDHLDPEWVRMKRQVARFVRGRAKPNERVLSLGCGIGVVEEVLIDEGVDPLEITEVGPEPLLWIAKKLPKDRVHIGFFPECLPKDRRYDLIYASALESLFDGEELTAFLRGVRERLTPAGRCLLVCPSIVPGGLPWVGEAVRGGAKAFLERLGLHHRGQWWGYQRTWNEMRREFAGAGFARMEEGMIEPKTRWTNYWIEGGCP